MIEKKEKTSLQKAITSLVTRYLDETKGQDVTDLYELLLEQVEPALLSVIIEETKYNQVKAAKILGVSRGTLRTKLKKYFDDKFIGSRPS